MTQFKQQYLQTEYGEKDEWQTPQWLFDALNGIFGFTVDAAANPANAKCKRFWTIEDNGLEKPWAFETVFCNPPHTEGQYGAWINKAVSEYFAHRSTSVLVLPFKAETQAFSGVWDRGRFLIIPRKRVRYVYHDGSTPSPTFHSCIAVFSGRTFNHADLLIMDTLGYAIDLRKGLVNRRT